jgi:hypothetical protein
MKKILSIFVAALFSATMFGASGVDWSTIEFLGDGAGGGAYTNKYKASTADGLTVINIQKPDWAAEAGIYAHVPAGITDCSVASTLQGAGLIMHLSAFTAQETEVTINYAGGSCKFWVYYADGTTGEGGGEGTDPTPTPEGENLFDASKASIKETYFAPNWAQETNSSATYDATAGTITVDLKSQFYGQWQAQVKLQHNVVFSAEKQYTISAKFHANTAIGGITLKMDDNAEVVMENQTINLVANETLNYTSKPGNGVEGNNQIIVFDFGWAVPAQITITDISIKEVGSAVAPPEVEHPAAAPAPTRDAAQVFSIYSDVYTTTVTRGMGGWGQTTREEEVQLAEGDKAFYYSTCNYLGWELNGNTTIGDLTAYPMLHMDVYVAEAGSIGFTPIWGGEAEKAYALQPGWNALDINLTADFVGINLANIFQLKWANMPATCYIDNVYFYGESTDVENITVENTATKVIENGQLIIIRNGVKFDATGKMMK